MNKQDRDGRWTGLAILVFTAVTNLADGALKVTLPLIGTSLTDSPLALGSLSAVLMLPTLLLSLHVGVLVDRYDRRRLMWMSSAVRVGSLGLLLVCEITGVLNLTAIYLIGFVLGIADVVAATAMSALIPTVIPKEGWEKTNAWVAGVETVAQEFCGPVVGGLLVAVGASFAVGASGVAYALSALTLVLLAGAATQARRPAGGSEESATRQIVEGIRFLWRQPILRLTSGTLTVLCACWGAWLALMPLIATRGMGLDSEEYGLLLGTLGVGGLLGAAGVAWLNRVFDRRWVMFADLVGTLAMVLVPLFTINIWAVGAAAFAGGVGGALWTVNARTISQHLVPDGMRGRFSATARVFTLGAVPVGAAVAGVLGELVGPRVALGVLSIPVLLLMGPFLRALTPERLADIFRPQETATVAPGDTVPQPSTLSE